MKRLDLNLPTDALAQTFFKLAGDDADRRAQALTMLSRLPRWDAVLALAGMWEPSVASALLRPQGAPAYLFLASKCKAASVATLDRLRDLGGIPESDDAAAKQTRVIPSWDRDAPPPVPLPRCAWLDEGLHDAVSGGDPARVQWWMAEGADLYHRVHCSCSVANCRRRTVVALASEPQMLEWLISQRAAAHDGKGWVCCAVRKLVGLNAYPELRRLSVHDLKLAELTWSPLHELVALRTAQELADALQGPDQDAWRAQLEARDESNFTPAMHAALQGAVDKLELLRDAGADMHAQWHGKSLVVWLIESGQPEALRWWLTLPGASVDMPLGSDGNTPLFEAVDSNLLPMAEVLLQTGADPHHYNNDHDCPMSLACSRAMQELLMAYGGSNEHFDRSSTRTWLGQPSLDEGGRFSWLVICTPEDAVAHHVARPGRYNGEQVTSPFHIAMLESLSCSFYAREEYGLPARGEGPLTQPIWTADRFGQSLTGLPDGRWVQVGGEHEDGYDPDFFIYADVIVHTPPSESGGAWDRRVYAYPEAVFPPTDFHTATLVGDRIIVIGCLGYAKQRRPGETPVYALDTRTWHIEQLHCTGDAPGWLFKHKARLAAPSVIEVWGGERLRQVSAPDQNSDFEALPGRWRLDLSRLQWQVVTPVVDEIGV